MHPRRSGNANEYAGHTYNYFVLKNRVICTMTMVFIACSYLLYIIIIFPFFHCLVYNSRIQYSVNVRNFSPHQSGLQQWAYSVLLRFQCVVQRAMWIYGRKWTKSIKYAIIIILHALVSQPQNHDTGFCYYSVFFSLSFLSKEQRFFKKPFLHAYAHESRFRSLLCSVASWLNRF